MATTRKKAREASDERKARVLKYMTQDPPVPFRNILALEGVTDRYLRKLIKAIEAENDLKYLGTINSRAGSEPPPGLTQATARLRANLANELYKLTQDKNPFGFNSRADVAFAIGLNQRDQLKAENKPFAYDWRLSEIERLARVLGEEPWEFYLKCLTT